MKGQGWRLDMCTSYLIWPCTGSADWMSVILSDRIANKTLACEIRDEIWGASDHCPVVLDMEVEDATADDRVEVSATA